MKKFRVKRDEEEKKFQYILRLLKLEKNKTR